MQGALQLEEAGSLAEAREYYLKAAAEFASACEAEAGSASVPIWSRYADLMLGKARTLARAVNQLQSDANKDTREDVASSAIVERPNTRFGDLVDLEEAKARLEETLLYPLVQPGLFAKLKVSPAKGILLYGPPGCGKTFVAQAAAGESGLCFIEASAAALLDKYVGETEKRVHELFQVARDRSPAVVFFDEIDALGTSRSSAQSGFEGRIVNELLREMDGLRSKSDRILVLGATNRPWAMDGALLRAGRFTEVVFVRHPDPDARASLFKLHLSDVPTGKLDFAKLAKWSAGFETSRVASACSEAGMILIRRKLRGTMGSDVVITMRELREAIESRSRNLIIPTWYEEAVKELTALGKTEQFDAVMLAAKDRELRP